MKRCLTLCSLLILLLSTMPALAQPKVKATYGNGSNHFTLATGSPGELGLLKELATFFTDQHQATMHWVKAGSGKSLALLKAKDVDVAMVHAPSAEKKAMAEGWAIKRSLLGSNAFYIVGPTG